MSEDSNLRCGVVARRFAFAQLAQHRPIDRDRRSALPGSVGSDRSGALDKGAGERCGNAFDVSHSGSPAGCLTTASLENGGAAGKKGFLPAAPHGDLAAATGILRGIALALLLWALLAAIVIGAFR